MRGMKIKISFCIQDLKFSVSYYFYEPLLKSSKLLQSDTFFLWQYLFVPTFLFRYEIPLFVYLFALHDVIYSQNPPGQITESARSLTPDLSNQFVGLV
jgi:hypothetical protein